MGAAQMGSFASLISAACAGFYILVFFGVMAGSTPETSAGLVAFAGWFFLAEFVVFILAGILLRSGKGAIPALLGSVFLALELLLKLASLSISIALVFNVILLIFTINGARGALALKRGVGDDEATAEIFR